VSIVNYELEDHGKNVQKLVHESADENATYVFVLIRVNATDITRVKFVTTMCDVQRPEVCMVESSLYVFVNELHHCYTRIEIDRGNSAARVDWCELTHADVRDQAIIAVRSLLQYKILAQGQHMNDVRGACRYLYDSHETWTPERKRVLSNTICFQICNKMERKLQTAKPDNQTQDHKLEHMSQLQSQMAEAMPQEVVNACLYTFRNPNKRPKYNPDADVHENKLDLVMQLCEIVVTQQVSKRLEECAAYFCVDETQDARMISIVEYMQGNAPPAVFQIGMRRAVVFPENVFVFTCSPESELCLAEARRVNAVSKVNAVSVGGLRKTLHSLLSNLVVSKRDLTDYADADGQETATKLVNDAAKLWSEDFRFNLFKIVWAQQLSDESDHAGRLAQNAMYEHYTLRLLNTHLHSIFSQ